MGDFFKSDASDDLKMLCQVCSIILDPLQILFQPLYLGSASDNLKTLCHAGSMRDFLWLSKEVEFLWS